MESRFQSLETKTKDLQLCSVDLDKKSTDLQANIGDLQVRTESLEQKWENHVTTFLQATSIVVARDGASSSDANREMTPLKGKLDAGEDL